MANKRAPKSVYSVRLDLATVQALQQSADNQRITVAATIRRAVDEYLTERNGEAYLEQMEIRLAASIQRLSKHQYLTRRAVDLAIAELEHQRGLFAVAHMKRQEGEDSAMLIARCRNNFMKFLANNMADNGMVRRLIRQMVDPDYVFTEPAPEGEPTQAEDGKNAE